MKGTAIPYSAEELAWIEAHCQDNRRETHAVFCAKFNRPEITLTNYNSLCKRKGWLTGRTGRFEQGQESWNEGRKMPFHPNSARTQFKKGGLPHNTNYLGHERVSRDGYVEISVAETNPHTGFERRYVFKHRWLWEQANGPLAKGMCLKCLDGNKENMDLANWEVIPRSMLPRLNGRYGRGYETAEPEIKPLIMTVTKLEHAARNSNQENA